MKECRKVKRLLSRYLDKETSTAESAMVAAHLDSCLVCQKELLELTRVKELILGKERKSLPEDYLVYRLREKIASQERPARKFSWLAGMGDISRRLIPVPIAVMAIVIALLVSSSQYYTSNYSLEDNILSGESVTAENVLELILGTQS